MDVIQPEELITYGPLVKEAMREYRDLLDSKQREHAAIEEKYQVKPSIPKTYPMEIENPFNKDLNKVDFRSHNGGNGSGSGGGSYIK